MFSVTMSRPDDSIKGRGAAANLPGRFALTTCEDDPEAEREAGPGPDTVLQPEQSRSIITRNESPDLPFHQSINPYRGCEHGCIYCYARPAHAYMDLSPGLDFETKLFFKPGAAALLRRELSRPGYECQPIALGSNTDAYQPAERDLRITRGILEVLAEFRHPVSLITKSSLVERDLDLLTDLARDNLVHVMVSVTTLDDELKRRMEPRTASPARRLAIIRRLSAAGIPTGVLFAPVIPALNDHELEAVLREAAAAGARGAAYVVLRLPHEVAPLFTDWLNRHYELRASHVLSLVRQMRDGNLNDPRFGTRMRGTGTLAKLLQQRFTKACRELGLNVGRDQPLNTMAFRATTGRQNQLPLL